MSDQQQLSFEEPDFGPGSFEREDTEHEQPSFQGFTDGPQQGPMLFRDEVPRSARMYEVAGRLYPMKTASRCNTCQSPYRYQIEKHVLHGFAYKRIANALPEDAGITDRAIARHVDNHMPLDEVQRRAVVESRAAEIGLDIYEHKRSLVDRLSFAKVGMQLAYERMVDGEVVPSIQDGLAFARIIQDMETDHDADVEILKRMLSAQLEVAQRVMTPEQRTEWAQQLNQHPYLREVAALDVVDAEVIEE